MKREQKGGAPVEEEEEEEQEERVSMEMAMVRHGPGNARKAFGREKEVEKKVRRVLPVLRA